MAGHELISSASLSALEKRFFEEVRKEKERDPLAPVVVLVGSFHLGRYLVRELARTQSGILNLRFVTIRELAKSLGCDVSAGDSRAELSGLLEEALLEEVVVKTELSYFGPVKKFDGFRGALKAALHDLRDAGFKDRIKELGEQKPGAGLNRDKILDLARLARAFFDAYQKDFFDDHDLLAAAAQNAGAFPDRFSASRLHVYGIYDFTWSQAELIRALAAALELKVYLPYADRPEFGFADRGLKFYSSLLKVKPEQLPAEFNGGGPLERTQAAAAGALPAKAKAGPGPGGVEIVAAPGALREVEEIAGRVLKFAEEGMDFYEMGVLVRDTELYLPLLREVFERAQIPVHAPELDTWDKTPAGQSALRLVDLIPEGRDWEFTRREVVELLAGPELKPPGLEDDEWRAASWNDYTIEAQVVHGREQWDRKLKALARQAEDQEKKRIEKFRKLVLGLVDELTALAGMSGFEKMGAAFQKLCEDLGLGLPLEDFPKTLHELDRLKIKAEPGAFKDLVRDWLASLKVEGDSRRFQAGAVTAGSIMELRLIRFRAVFAPGMQSRSFPAPARDDSILLDHERTALNRLFKAPEALSEKRKRPVEDRLLFALIAQAATEKLVLTYSRTDEQGAKERLPSPFLVTAAGAASGENATCSTIAEGGAGVTLVPFSRARRLMQNPEAPDDRPALDDDEALVWACARGRFSRDRLPERLAESRPFLARGLNLIAMRARGSTSPFLGRLAGDEAREQTKKIFSDRIFSNSQLEKYAKCPYYYFCNKLMELERPALPEEAEFEAVNFGGLVHNALRAFMERLQQKKMLPLAGQDDGRLLKLLEKEFEACLAGEEYEAFRGTLDWKLMKEGLKQDLPPLLDSLKKCEREGFSPVAFELGFGCGDQRKGIAYSHPEPVRLELPDGEVIRLRGYIDRLDRSPEGALRLIDYKTSNSTVRQKDLIRGGTALQRPLYLIAAGKITGKEIDELADSESGYVYVMGAGERTIAGEKDDLSRALSAVAAIVRGMKAGLFAPLAATLEIANLCDRYCDYKELCGSGRKGLRERLSENDPARKLREELDSYD